MREEKRVLAARLHPDIRREVELFAARDHRSVSNAVEVLLRKALSLEQQHELVGG